MNIACLGFGIVMVSRIAFMKKGLPLWGGLGILPEFG